MAKGRRGRLIRRTVDMAVKPETYKRPPRVLCREWRTTMHLTDEDLLHVRTLSHNNKIVEFAVTQVTLANGQWTNVARIDTCHGTLHEHLFDHRGKILVDHRLICEIPPDGGGELLKNLYHQSLKSMQNEWADNLRRWSGDRA